MQKREFSLGEDATEGVALGKVAKEGVLHRAVDTRRVSVARGGRTGRAQRQRTQQERIKQESSKRR